VCGFIICTCWLSVVAYLALVVLVVVFVKMNKEIRVVSARLLLEGKEKVAILRRAPKHVGRDIQGRDMFKGDL